MAALKADSLFARRYSGAFDTGPDRCKDCGDDLRLLMKRVPRRSYGFEDIHVGEICLLCGPESRVP